LQFALLTRKGIGYPEAVQRLKEPVLRHHFGVRHPAEGKHGVEPPRWWLDALAQQVLRLGHHVVAQEQIAPMLVDELV
jgi:hypothetical protein